MNDSLESLTGFHFLDPWMLWLALLIPAVLWWRRWRGSAAIHFAPGEFLKEGLPRSWRMRCLAIPGILQVCGLLLVIVALARPVHRDRLPLQTEGIDILLCLDVSSSMAARDLDPQRTRLEVAKAAAEQFISGRFSDRIGLLPFARYPDLRCPLTLDQTATKQFLSEIAMVEPRSPEDATGIGTAVARAAQLLRKSVAKSKVIVLLTDGEENVAGAHAPEEITPAQAATLCKELGIRVYTIAAGLGSRDPFGRWIKVDTTQVRELAEKTQGKFFEARDAKAVSAVYAAIDKLEKVELQEPRFRISEAFLPFLAIAMFLLLASRLLKSTVLELLP